MTTTLELQLDVVTLTPPNATNAAWVTLTFSEIGPLLMLRNPFRGPIATRVRNRTASPTYR